jgi:phage-related protein (TIGR01555 family)
MSKKNKAVKKQQPKQVDKTVKKAAQDSFSNVLGRLGMDQPGMMGATDYKLTRLTRDYNLMNALYRNSWIAKKIIDTIPEDMCKNWFSITADLEPEYTDRYNALEQRTLVRDKILEGICWGRLYGGAGAIMMINGHQDKLDEPLDYDDIMPNSFCGLMVLDRWSGIFPGTELITDITDPEFGLAKYYEVRDIEKDNVLSIVHHSRVIRFTGRKLPFWENQAEIGWGAAELEHVFDELAKRDNTSWNIASLVFQANLLVNKIDGLDQLSSMGDPDMQRDLYNVKSAQNQMRNNNGMMLIGKNEEITSMNYTFAGLNDIYESQMLDVAGAAEIPVTKLFGRAPAGLNATGESDMQNYYDKIAKDQESTLKPKINKLLPVMFMSEFGFIPNDLGVKFNSIQTPTEDKVAEIVGKKVDSITKVYGEGIINHRMALTELHEMSYTTNMFTSITEKDIAKADDQFRQDDVVPDIEGLIDPLVDKAVS